ncbi:MAG: hypothetical protein L0Z62_06255, partial [Gemmataceae bacterium]|nr:hypothetical protein [Gemmataceae bacterium]
MKTITGLAWVVGLWVAGEGLASAAEPPSELARWLKPQAWERDTPGPILSLGKAGAFDDQHIFAPAVVEERGEFLLWYSGSRGAPGNRVFRLGLATGKDGKQFARHQENPVLQFQEGARSVLTPALLRKGDGTVLREGGKLRMWFIGATLGKGGKHTLHETSSADGIRWADPSPALLENVYCPTVLKTEDGYRMWYSDVSKRPWVIRQATSPDGRKWAVTEEPVLHLSQEWEAEVLVYPTVLKVDGVYLMWYGSYYSAVRREKTAIGFAASVDGLKWYKHPQNPVLRPDPKRPWESNYVGSGCVLRRADGSFRYWYASRKEPPFLNLYFAINTARWAGPAAVEQPAEKDAPPEHIKAYLRRCEAARAAAIKAREAEVKALAREPRPTDETRKKLRAAEAQLKRLHEGPAPLVSLPLPPRKGDMGVFESVGARRARSVDVLEVIDSEQAIIRAWHEPAGTPAGEVTFVDLWVRGIDTKGLTAGAPARLPQVFHVTGNKLIDTTCGKRSLPLLEALDIERYRKPARSSPGTRQGRARP